MNKHYIIGNWKSNKTLEEAENWIKEFISLVKSRPLPEENPSEIILCPSYHHLPLLKDRIMNSHLPIKLGAQNISSFPSGAYTGEVSAQSLRGIIDYCIIGHSERRRLFHETDELIAKKAIELQNHGITPILCVENDHAHVPAGVKFVAFEPPAAIGSGNAADPAMVNLVAKTIRQNDPESVVFYGGSATPENASQFTMQSDISGLLIGSTSLNPDDFYKLLYATASH